MNPDIAKTLQATQSQVFPLISKYLESSLVFPKFCQVDPQYQSLLDFQSQLISEYPSRKGKYLRPTLLLLTAQSMGVCLDQALLSAAAMQLSEEWILVHDDFEDNSLERRGLPALHHQFSPELAVNAGDALHVVMWQMIYDTNHPQIFNEFVQLLNRTTFGQTIDIYWNQMNKVDLTDEDIFLIMESKTCYYTISGPMRLGAILAGATNLQLEKIYQFGRYLGRSFQIVDDLLDLTSDFAGQKKQQYNDLYEGKRTIMLAHLLRSVTVSERQSIVAILQKDRQHKTSSEVMQIYHLMQKYDSLNYAKKLALDFSVQAKDIFDNDLQFISEAPYRQQLSSLIDFVVHRDH